MDTQENAQPKLQPSSDTSESKESSSHTPNDQLAQMVDDPRVKLWRLLGAMNPATVRRACSLLEDHAHLQRRKGEEIQAMVEPVLPVVSMFVGQMGIDPGELLTSMFGDAEETASLANLLRQLAAYAREDCE